MYEQRRLPPETFQSASLDLLLVDDAEIAPSQNILDPFTHSLPLHNSDATNSKLHISLRSRLAHLGVQLAGHSYENGMSYAHVFNVGPRTIKLCRGAGLGALYQPSLPISGDVLRDFVSSNIIVEEKHWNLFTRTGQPANGSYQSEILLGIRTNRDEFYEVDGPSEESITVRSNGDERSTVAQYLRKIKGESAETHFAVGSTVPIELPNNVYLRLITDQYSPLTHLSSVVIRPSSKWRTSQGHDSGIRCEYVHNEGKCVKRDDLPEFVFFTVHPQLMTE